MKWPEIAAYDIKPGLVISFGDHTEALRVRAVRRIGAYLEITYGGRWFRRKVRMAGVYQRCWIMNAGER